MSADLLSKTSIELFFSVLVIPNKDENIEQSTKWIKTEGEQR